MRRIIDELTIAQQYNKLPSAVEATSFQLIPTLPVVSCKVAQNIQDWIVSQRCRYSGEMMYTVSLLLSLMDFNNLPAKAWKAIIEAAHNIDFGLDDNHARVSDFHAKVIPEYTLGVSCVAGVEFLTYSLALPGCYPIVACLFRLQYPGPNYRVSTFWHMFIPGKGNTLDVEYRKGIPYYTFWPAGDNADKLAAIAPGDLQQSITKYINSCNVTDAYTRFTAQQQ